MKFDEIDMSDWADKSTCCSGPVEWYVSNPSAAEDNGNVLVIFDARCRRNCKKYQRSKEAVSRKYKQWVEKDSLPW